MAVDWDSPTWGHNPIHVAAWCADAHDSSEEAACSAA